MNVCSDEGTSLAGLVSLKDASIKCVVTVKGDAPAFHPQSGVADETVLAVFAKNASHLKDIMATQILKVCHFPDSLTEVPAHCFEGSALEVVTFGRMSRVRHFGCKAFSRTSITRIEVPATVVIISLSCFEDCALLRRVQFQENASLIHMGEAAFKCSGLRGIDIPDSVVEIDNKCFENCPLERLTFGPSPSLSRIGAAAFARTRITSVELPMTLVKLESEAFMWCEDLAFVWLSESQMNEIGVSTFLSSGIQRLVVPDSVVDIKEGAFGWSRQFSSIVFGALSSATLFDKEAFCSTTFSALQSPVA